MTAKLQVEADASSIRLFFSDMTESSRRSTEAMSRHFTTYLKAVEAGYAHLRQTTAASMAAIDSDQKRFEDAQLARARTRQQQEQQFTGGYRDNAYREQEQKAEQSEKKITEIVKRGSRERMGAVQKEAKERAKAIEDGFKAIGNAAGELFSMYSENRQSSRERRAATQTTVADAIKQAGGTFAEVDPTTERLRRFAVDQRIKEGDLASALAGYQTTYSGLGDNNTTAAQRGANLDKFFKYAQVSRDVGLSVEEGTGLAGEMARQGVTDEKLVMEALNATAAIGQRGSVEGRDVLKQAKGPLVTRIKRAVAAAQLQGVSGEALQKVVVETLRDVMAEAEVSAASGERVGTASTNLKNFQAELISPTRQAKMFENIEDAKQMTKEQKAALLGALFARDKNGKLTHHLRDGLTDPTAFAEAWTSAVGTDPKLVGALEGIGHGMSITGPRRKMLEYLVGADTTGKTGWQTQRDIRGASLSDADVARQREIAMNLDEAVMASEKTQGDINTYGGPGPTSALGDLSDWYSRLKRTDPNAAGALKVGGGIAGGLLARYATPLLARLLASLAPSMIGETALGTAGRLAGPIGLAAGILLDPNKSIESGDEEHARLDAHRRWNRFRDVATKEQQDQLVGSVADQQGPLMGGLMRTKYASDPEGFAALFGRVIAAALAAELAKTTVNVTVNPAQIEHARSANAGQQPRTPVQ